MKLHHIAYLVKSIDKAIQAFESLGYHLESLTGEEPVVWDEDRGCDICFMRLSSDPSDHSSYVELVAPRNDESPIYGLLSKYKNSPYHLCFETSDPQAEIEKLKSSGWMVFQPDARAVAFGEKHVTFLMHRQIGIIELVYEPYQRQGE